MDAWQMVLAVVLVGVPLVLLGVFHPASERLSARGKPLARDWRPAVPPVVADDEH